MECNENYFPIIGIVSNAHTDDEDDSNKSLIYHIYIAWIEENGGKVVPIHPWYTESELLCILSKVNGVLMQGGSRTINLCKPFEKMNKFILDYVIKTNSIDKKVFPLWGTCQGIELLYAILHDDLNVNTKFNSWKHYIPMEYNDNIIRNSKMFKYFTDEDFKVYSTTPCTIHLHNYGIYIKYDNNIHFAKEYKESVHLEVTSYAKDRDGKEFIGTCEDKRNNIYACIFHPEDLPFNYGLSVHDDVFLEEGVRVSNLLAKGFIETAKMNTNRFESIEDLRKYEFVEFSNRITYKHYQPAEEDYDYEVIIFNKK